MPGKREDKPAPTGPSVALERFDPLELLRKDENPKEEKRVLLPKNLEVEYNEEPVQQLEVQYENPNVSCNVKVQYIYDASFSYH